jgi:hypothetical protein
MRAYIFFLKLVKIYAENLIFSKHILLKLKLFSNLIFQINIEVNFKT